MRPRDLFVLTFVITAVTAAIYYYAAGRGQPAVTATLPATAAPGPTEAEAPIQIEDASTSAVAPVKASIPKSARGDDARAAIADGRMNEVDISEYFERRLNARPETQFEGEEQTPIDDFADKDGR